jgi:hypothetical protein
MEDRCPGGLAAEMRQSPTHPTPVSLRTGHMWPNLSLREVSLSSMRDVSPGVPIGSVDLSAEGHEIWPCGRCQPWHLEILRDPETDEVFAREWHALDCSAYVALLAAAEVLLAGGEPER